MGKVQKVDGAKLGTVCYRQNPEELKNAVLGVTLIHSCVI